jgi:Intrinsic membrane protein PufX
MADRLYYHEDGSKALRSWVLSKMMEGAGWAALFVVGIGVALLLLVWLGGFLPEASKQAPDPTPESSLIVPTGPTRTA